jgi:hypothetical protein
MVPKAKTKKSATSKVSQKLLEDEQRFNKEKSYRRGISMGLYIAQQAMEAGIDVNGLWAYRFSDVGEWEYSAGIERRARAGLAEWEPVPDFKPFLPKKEGTQ